MATSKDTIEYYSRAKDISVSSLDVGALAVGDDESTIAGGTLTGGTHKNSSQMEGKDHLAMKETLALKRTKVFLLLIMATTAAVAAGVAFCSAKGEETKDFEEQFYDYAATIDELIHVEVNNALVSVDSMSHTITSYTEATNATWPFVAIPHFEVSGHDATQMTSIVSVTFSPLVVEQHRDAYEVFTMYNQGWITDGMKYSPGTSDTVDPLGIPSKIYYLDESGNPRVQQGINGPFLPRWQQFPVPHRLIDVNFDLFSLKTYEQAYGNMMTERRTIISMATSLLESARDGNKAPYSLVMGPVYNRLTPPSEDKTKKVVGVVSAVLDWGAFFATLLPVHSHPVVVVMDGSCGDIFSFGIRGHDVDFLGYEDLHEEEYTRLARSTTIALHGSECYYELLVYPSKELENAYRTDQPIWYGVGMIMVFAFTAFVFLVYDMYVHRRQEKVMSNAAKSNAIVASLFPKNVTDRMMKDLEEQMEKNSSSRAFRFVPKTQIKDFLDESAGTANVSAYDTPPIAELFPATTVLFADIAGFTAWSSVREPTQVFTLLETLYASFDSIAKRRRVFKVETIGDCYVAVTGLPDPRKDHATAMARFAREILAIASQLTKNLEISLGPETGDLDLRVGLHSGPVTAGVLRGDKSRFQLFGDTVNVASRMESNGKIGKIHISMDTAELLREAGKGAWVEDREEVILAKGKGKMRTAWLLPSVRNVTEAETVLDISADHKRRVLDSSPQPPSANMEDPVKEPETKSLSPKLNRLVRWNADVLVRLLKAIVARRNATQDLGATSHIPKSAYHHPHSNETDFNRSGTVLSEVKEIIALPKFDVRAVKNQQDPRTIELDHVVVDQLISYITIIASLYRENPFHNFEHASHVAMSVTKMLSRIVAPEEVLSANEEDDNVIHKNLHDHTYGITSDPLTQFAVVFAALVHDVDHYGVPNPQMIREKSRLAEIYQGKSILEQNSVDIALDLLDDDDFEELRSTIYSTQNEKTRFRQLVVNTVMATDIVDRDLKALREQRWETAFAHKPLKDASAIEEDVNRKATIVIEHLIQASDVSHTMQHWHIYRKWNESFFIENMKAFKEGRCPKDPSELWYQAEMGFFDFYIIPLAKKLKDCGVFGVSCDEYLNYAKANRKEWEDRGEEAVVEMLEKFKEMYPDDKTNNDESESEKQQRKLAAVPSSRQLAS